MFAVFKTLPSSATAAAALLVVSGSAAFPQDAAPDVRLAPQTAVYELSLERSNDGTIAAAEGRLAVQLTDTCEGYALSERMVLELFPADGEPTVIDSQFSSYEARDHSLYRYSSKLIVNGSEDLTVQYSGQELRIRWGASFVRVATAVNNDDQVQEILVSLDPSAASAAAGVKCYNNGVAVTGITQDTWAQGEILEPSTATSYVLAHNVSGREITGDVEDIYAG
ncbi:MAG: DUF1849 family protein, partial [Pseudomonadota bacterium]